MNDFIIQKYINNITINNIIDFSKKEGIILSNEEANIIYEYIKKYWKVFYHGDPTKLFNELKQKLSPKVYSKAKELYLYAKEKIKNY